MDEQAVWTQDEPSPSLVSHPLTDNNQMWDQFVDQRDSITKLTDQVENMRRQLMALGATPTGSTRCTAQEAACGDQFDRGFAQEDYDNVTSAAQTAPVLPYHEAASAAGPMDITQPVASLMAQMAAAAVSAPRRSPYGGPPVTPPFDPETRGANVEISADGYTASRTRGCRQAAAIGSSPLQPQAYGRYFEVTVEETVTGWVGGLGIGVTATPPREIRRLPDKAWKMPATFIVGYWGCIFADGAENPTNWRPDTLGPGARVGLLVAETGEVIIFVDGRAVVRIDNVKLASKEALYPVVDVFSAARSVTLREQAAVPQPPWTVQADPAADHRYSEATRSSPGGSIAESSIVGGSYAGGGSLAGSLAGASSAFGMHGRHH